MRNPAVHPVALRLLRALAFAVSFTACAVAQTAAGGGIEGRVFGAAHGGYLENARVAIEGTALETLTDAGGYYRLANVPAGTVRLRVHFIGAASTTEAVVVTAGQTTTRDITLGGAPAAKGAAAGEVVALSKFVVATSKEMDGAAIAINEQRVAPNIKNVVTADEFGTIVDGTPGEAIKFLPGVMLTYSAGEAREVSINGVPTANVPVTVGGFDLASNAGGGTGRQTNFEQISINNMSRIEVIQSPTPESQGSALGGSVNMIPRSAFERSRPTVTYSVYEMMKDSDKHYNKTPGPSFRDPYRKITPGFQLSAVVPVSRSFGFTFSANGATQYVPNDVITLQWRGANTATNGAAFPDTSFDKPYLTQTQINDDLRLNKTTSAGLTLDFRLSPHDTLSFSTIYTYITVDHIGHRMTFTINRVASARDFGPTFTHGATGTGAGTLQLEDVNSRYWLGTTSMESLTYRHNGALWKAEAGLGYSYAGQHNRDVARGILRNSVAQRTNVTIAFDDIFYLRPNRITVTDGATGAPVDPYSLANYTLTSANYQEDNWLTFRNTAYGNLQRTFMVRETPLTLKGGFDVRQLIRDIRGPQIALTPNGAGLAGGTNAARFLDENLSQRPLPYGFPRAQWVDNSELYTYWQQNPGFLTSNANTIYRSQVSTSKWMAETISSLYLRGDTAFFNRRLQLTGGFRAEQTNAQGKGPLTDPTLNYQRDASGRVLRDAAGRALLTMPANTGNLAYSRLTFIERGSKTDKEYLRVLPSLNATWLFRDNLRLQSAFYESLGRPNFAQYANGITLPDTDGGPVPGNPITVSNAGIKAWSAKTVKVRLEYYFDGVGQASIGAYRRDFKDFFGSTSLRATPEFLALYDLDPATYDGYYVSTNYNLPGTVRSHGLEFSYRQALTFLPHWARGVNPSPTPPCSASRATPAAAASTARSSRSRAASAWASRARATA